MKPIHQRAITLLQQLISNQSFSGEEIGTAVALEQFLSDAGIPFNRWQNCVWATNAKFDAQKPTLLLNSHHDTVKPNKGYTRDPYLPEIIDGKLYGLGSNDAGGCLVSLLSTFVHFYHDDLPFNLLFAGTGEEENSGPNGLRGLLPHLPKLDFAIVGEPTLMQLAVAEKGLMVLDVYVDGKAGHAAREEGINAIYKSLEVVKWFEDYRFEKVSDLLGPMKMTVTQINAGQQHNVVPALCQLVVDIRLNEFYTHEEVLDIIRSSVQARIDPRSMNFRPSSIAMDHPLVKSGLGLGRTPYGSPTLSDQCVLDIPSLKMGPGDSARSHSADEFIYVDEIVEGIDLYIELLKNLAL